MNKKAIKKDQLSIEERIASLEDALLHQNEISFDILCEKYVDDCAMKIMHAMITSDAACSCKLNLGKVIENSYNIAELMLEEKLKRKNKEI